MYYTMEDAVVGRTEAYRLEAVVVDRDEVEVS